MYRILMDGLLYPKNLIGYRNKSGCFVFAFFALLSLFMTIGTALFFVRYAGGSAFKAENVACEYASGTLVCDAAQVDADPLDFFGSDAYFLPSNVDAGTVIPAAGTAIVFQDRFIAFFSDGENLMVLDLSQTAFGSPSLSAVMDGATTFFMVTAIVASYFGNIILLAAFALMSSLSLIRLRGFLRFGKAYTVIAFASVPFALLLTFHNLLGFPDWLLIVLMAVAFRSPMLAIREIFVSAYAYLQHDPNASPEDGGNPPDDDGGDDADDDSPKDGETDDEDDDRT
ncbi:MAG: hypothetical protein WC509_05815 [Candidatus Izemoplasmatales bacterium]